jgi:hypothetical protein
MRFALTIGVAVLLGALPAQACEDYVEAQADATKIEAKVAVVTPSAPAALELSAAMEKKKPAKKVGKKKEKVEYMRAAN